MAGHVCSSAHSTTCRARWLRQQGVKERSETVSVHGRMPAPESSLLLMLGSSAGSPALLGAQRSTAMHHPDGDSAVPAPCWGGPLTRPPILDASG